MKELLRKAFEAGKDKQWDIEWQMGRSKPDFEEWYKEHESQVLNIPAVLAQSEQFCDHKCKPMVNSDWTYLRCECGKRFEPKG